MLFKKNKKLHNAATAYARLNGYAVQCLRRFMGCARFYGYAVSMFLV